MNITRKISAIVPAAGVGFRMNNHIPKQYIKIGSMTIIEHTLAKLVTHPKIDTVMVVINSNDDMFNKLAIASHPKIKVTYGGETRADSVLAGLMLLDANDWALVHDAARPCVAMDDISRLIETVVNSQRGGILATRISDTIKRAYPVDSVIEKSVDRSYLWAAATPQLFNVAELKSCLRQALQNHVAITDEASAIEYCGGHPLLVECRRDNIKITRPEDVALATYYLTKHSSDR
nr:2-C-methyl-D-erythritol 4-phosphate cytidylyltransferase [Gilliamella apicola]